MVPSHKLSRRVLRVVLFALAICMGMLGGILALDSFIPREKPVSVWVYIVQFLIGVMFLTVAVYIGRRNRLKWKTSQQAGGPDGNAEHLHGE